MKDLYHSFRSHLPYQLLFLIVWLLSFRYFLTSDYHVVGHNWDWNFPLLKEQLQRLHFFSTYSWNDHNLGMPLSLQSHFFINLLISKLAYFFSVKQIIILILFSTTYIAYNSYKNFIDYFFKFSYFNYIPALLFSFSPFLFNEIIGGSWYMWVSYAIIPTLLVVFAKYLHSNQFSLLIGYLFLTTINIVSLQNFVLTEAVIFLYVIYQFFQNRKSFLTVLRRYLYSHLTLILIHAYWLIPFIYSSKNLFTLFTSTKFTGNFAGAITSTQDILSLFSLHGYLDRNIYFHALPQAIAFIYIISIFLFWVFTVYSFFHLNKITLKSKIVFWILIAIITAFIAKGANPPFGEVTMAIFNYFPLMSLYRSPQHLVLGMSLTIPIIMAYTLEYYFPKSTLKKNAITLVLVMIWISGWWVSGDLGTNLLTSKKKDRLDFYKLPYDLIEFYKNDLNSSANESRTLFLPSVCSPTYIANEYQKKAQGGIAEYSYLEHPTFCSESNDFAVLIDDYFCQGKEGELTNFLAIFNINQVILRNDIYPVHTRCGILKDWDEEKVIATLDQFDTLSLDSVTPTLRQYSLNPEFTLPLISIPSSVKVVESELSGKDELIKTKFNSQEIVIFSSQNINEEPHNMTIDANLTFQKKSPISYHLKVNTNESPFLINFATNFDPGWVLSTNSNKFFGLINPLIPSTHLVTNGYSNGWLVDPKQVCTQSPSSCITENDHQVINLSLEYYPQRFFYLGVLTSIISSMLLLFFYLLKK